MRSAVWLLLALALPGCSRSAPAKPPVRVAAASDLSVAFEAMRGPFEQQSGQKLELIFGSSGKLARQLTEGAPFDLFASASQEFTDEPIRTGACDGSSRAQYAVGRLVIDSPRQPLQRIDQLEDPRFVRIAIANPEHAPYGRAAREALTRAGIWAAIEPKIVYAETVQQALQLSRSGNVEAALVARALAKDGVPVDASLHGPLVQSLVVCTRGANRDGARAFAQVLLGEAGRAQLEAAGFELPPAGSR